MRITHVFAGVAVTDFAAACDWYQRLFGRPPDDLPTEGEAIWQQTDSSAIFVRADPYRAGGGLLALAVDNLDEQQSGFVRRGLSIDEGVIGAMRTLTISDPDGNTITIFEDPARFSTD